MKIFGHPWIESIAFYPVENIESIKSSPASSLLQIEKFSSNIELIQYCYANNLPYIVEVVTIKEAIFANSLGAKYILTEKALAIGIMPLAQHYLFDTQILASISDEFEIEEMAKIGVDGVYFKQ